MLNWWVELREVWSLIQASVLVSGSQSEALNEWFRQLAWYIFGDNSVKTSVAMTAPVSSEKLSGVSIAMTTPVSSQEESEGYRISFTMPSTYTLDTLPVPNNDAISFVELPSKKYYVWTFSWWANEARANKQLAVFVAALNSQGLIYSALPILNQYNDPWTIRFMRTNEWWIEVQ